MRGIRVDLRQRYPAAVGATDPAWNTFTGTLTRTGQVDWQNANSMRVAADTMTRQIAKQASQQNASASLLLKGGLAGLFCALIAAGFLLSGVGATETEIRRTLAQLTDSQNLFDQSINAIEEGYIIQDKAGVILLSNAGTERVLGVSAEELTGHSAERPGWRFVGSDGCDLPRAKHPSRLALETGLSQEAVVVGIQQPHREIAWLSMRAAPVFHSGQNLPYAAVLTFTDITEKKKTEDEKKKIEEDLQAEREFQQAMLESIQSGIVACDSDGILTLFNQAAREFHGLPEEPLPPDQWSDHFDLYCSDGITPLPTHKIPLFRALQGEIVRDTEMVIAPAGARQRTLLASGQAIYSSSGKKLGAVAAMYDITARRQTERELARLAAIVESSEEAILATTLDGTLVSWNAAAARLYGYSESEVIGQHMSCLVPAGEASPIDAVIPRLLRGELIEPIASERIRRDGTAVHVLLTFSPIHNMDVSVIGLSCIARDITAQRQAEDALRESEARLRYLSDASFEGIAVSRNGIILDANPAFLRLYGYETREQLVGLAATDLAAPEYRELVSHKIAIGAEAAYETVCLRQDGSIFQAEVRGRSILWDGLPARVTALRDVTERKSMEEDLRVGHRAVQESEARLAVAQRIGKVGSWEFDPVSGEVLWSGEMFRLLGRDPAAGVPAFQEAMAHYHPEDAPQLISLVKRAAQEGVGYETDLRGEPRFSPDGSVRWFHTTGEVSRDADGRVVRLAGTLADVTERKTMEDALRHSEEALRALMSSAPVILYAVDAAGIVTLSEGTGLAALGLAPGEAVGRSVFEFSGGDPLMDQNTRRALAGEVVSYDANVGSLCLHVELRPQYSPAGTVSGLIGVCFDITERAQSEERFRVLFEQSSDAHLLFDETGIVDCNNAAIAMLHCSDKSEVLSLHPAVLSPELQPDGERSDVKCIAMDAAAREYGYHRFEWMHRKMDGEEFPVEVTLTPVTLQKKPVLLVVWHDLTERNQTDQQIKDYMVVLEFQKSQLEESNRELEALATTDGLTGLKNHRTFQEKLNEEHPRAVRYHQPLSLLLLDVDHFKQYNDSFGHPAGDAVLRQVSAILTHTARDTDVAARYGGEEFVLILPQTDEAGAQVIAERIRVAVANASWDQRPITVSIGVATLSLDTPTPGSLTACADKALYQSKTLGRNRVTHGNPAAPPVSGPVRPRRPRAASLPSQVGASDESSRAEELSEAEAA